MQIKHFQIRLSTLLLILYTCNILAVSCRPALEEKVPQIFMEEAAQEENLFIRTYEHLTDKERNQVEKCERDLILMELCMRCAKATKSPNAYPMCCGNEESAKKFCEDFVYYGSH